MLCASGLRPNEALSFLRKPIFRRSPFPDVALARTVAVGLHPGRGLCPGHDLCRGPDRRSGPQRLDLPEVLGVLLARPLEWWSTRQPAAIARTNPQSMISSFRFSPMASLGHTAAASPRT